MKGWIKILLLFRRKQVVANCLYSMSPGLLGVMSSTGQGGHAQLWLLTTRCHLKSLGKYDLFELETSTAQIFLKCLNLPDEAYIVSHLASTWLLTLSAPHTLTLMDKQLKV